MSTEAPEYRTRCEHRRTFAERRILALAVPAFGALIAEPIFRTHRFPPSSVNSAAELAGMRIAATLVTTVVGLAELPRLLVTPAVARAFGEKNLRRAWQIGVTGVWSRLRPRHTPHRSPDTPSQTLLRGLGATDETMSYAPRRYHFAGVSRR